MVRSNRYELESAQTRRSKSARGMLLVTGIVFPAICLLLLTASEPRATWQSDQLHAYASFLLSGKIPLAFWPFVAYSTVCFGCFLFRRALARRYLVVRLGVYTGILLAMQYCLISGIVVLDVKTILSAGGVLKLLAIAVFGCLINAVPLALRWLWRRSMEEEGQELGVWSKVVVVLIFVGALSLPLCFPFGVMLTIISTPFWALTSYVSVARAMTRFHHGRWQFSLREVLAGMTWLAAYLAAWRFAVREALHAYSQLPTSPPSDCYVASAAAHGHARFVGSWTTAGADDNDRGVNLQLKWLKCGEIVWRTTSPRTHRYVRRAYDRWGPVLAARLRNPWLADAAYLSLKPIEWTVRLILCIVLPDAGQLAQRVYS